MAERSRARQTVGDMVRSLAVVMAGVAVLVVFAFLPEGEKVREVPQTDLTSALGQAEASAAYDVAVPTGLPSSWRLTSARFDADTEWGAVWHLGYVTPGDSYAGVEQTDGDLDDLEDVIDGQLPQPQPDGVQVVDGVEWQKVVDEETGRRGLLLDAGDSRVGVVGSASWDELGRLAKSLRLD